MANRYLITGSQLGVFNGFAKCLNQNNLTEIKKHMQDLIMEILNEQHVGYTENNVVDDVNKILDLKLFD